ncbi:elongation factor P 5-aminopentanone reductase [Brevibacillus laterosporus]|uniref:elongation factor P 5-aminopentanone reductase n=1 Tax=Brevibacillus laterosporus TaxID=1465 RepID=UPI000379B6D9|nr:SDR family oxidoreductase [Brevibacillus laterosporus]ATO47881.1 3-ketoacyl-ACP reductase [Brevibacillus laterosporus DSM 25]AYB37351.1 SDR family oxidoreductase [Brevibacillus laterosporus]MBG9800128.1 3-ketoacyl-ACP reductase [Brevibacillus laterosporus]MBG9803760.1 3-ketoacyl-ACP reductase [Brevibacillus laterosporus]MBM7107459.1 3-oxoacyl-[acyl-carrier-protein] reductase FabG [Brevibacillus laterosporus]
MEDKQVWALVTGASGEIGQAIARKLADESIPLYLHYNTQIDKINLLLSYCESKNVPAIALQADLSQPDAVTTMFTQMPVKPLYIINNASIDHVGLLSEVSPELFDELVRVNMGSCFFVSQHGLPAMLQARFGRIVTISSIWGETGAACEVLYSMTKGAILSFTKALAKEVALNHITVNAVSPGAVSGGMMDRFTLEDREAVCEEIPMGRLGRPEEVAVAVSFLLQKEAEYITGQTISVNGGWHT